MESDPVSGQDEKKVQLLQAVETFAELALGSKLDEVRHEVGRVESDLARILQEEADRLKAEIAEVKGGLEDMRGEVAGVKDDLGSRRETLIRSIAEVAEAGKRALTGLEMRTEAELTDAKKAFDEAEERTEKRLSGMKDTLEKELASREENVRAELDSIASVIAHLDSEMRLQRQSIEQVSSVLQNLAGVFGSAPGRGRARGDMVPGRQESPRDNQDTSPAGQGASGKPRDRSGAAHDGSWSDVGEAVRAADAESDASSLGTPGESSRHPDPDSEIEVLLDKAF